MTNEDISIVLRRLRKTITKWRSPVVNQIENSGKPFRVLISCILSLRTQDKITALVSENLLRLADSPSKMLKLSSSLVEKTIYPAAFYRVKAKTILNICKELIEKYNEKVPDDIEELLKLKGIGRKTANLTITMGYGKLGVCVDTHVHRIANRWGYVKTQNPNQTEIVLRKKLPKRYWAEINNLLVAFGQNACKPISPHCSECCVSDFCMQKGVNQSR